LQECATCGGWLRVLARQTGFAGCSTSFRPFG
jgi:hypothetical protein